MTSNFPNKISIASLSRYKQRKQLLKQVLRENLPPGGLIPNLSYVLGRVQQLKTLLTGSQLQEIASIEQDLLLLQKRIQLIHPTNET